MTNAIKSIFASLLLQIVTFLCGLVVPRAIIGTYGSAVNGTISSITQFLSYITLLEGGVGGVIKAALYKPISEHNNESISSILRATRDFFKKVSYIYIVYLLCLSFLYPFIVNTGIEYDTVVYLTLAIGISTIFQYYFGITDQIFLQADNRIYIVSFWQAISVLINAIITLILIKLNCSILVVKIFSSVIFAARPLIIHYYVRSHYSINYRAMPDVDAIKQRWNGFGQHLAFFIHSNTDIVVLSIFVGVSLTSVYSVYLMVVSGIQRIVNSIITSFNAVFGSLYAQGNKEKLNSFFCIIESFSIMLIVCLFGSTALLIIPFVNVYTHGIRDINYIIPSFGYLMILSEVLYCLRIPFSSIILAAGRYKETRRGAYIEATLNILISLVLVNRYGLHGVVVGTIVAMCFRTSDYIIYLSKHIINHSPLIFAKKLIVNITFFVICSFIIRAFPLLSVENYFSWFIKAIYVFSINAIGLLIGNYIFFRNDIRGVYDSITKRLNKSRR